MREYHKSAESVSCAVKCCGVFEVVCIKSANAKIYQNICVAKHIILL